MNKENYQSTLNTNLTDEQITDLARPLIGILGEFYKNPKNEKNFQEWLKRKEKNNKK